MQAILDIIASQSVKSQGEFVRLLAKRGYEVTQATLSRDLKALKVTKVATDNGGYVYILPDSNEVKDKMLTLNLLEDDLGVVGEADIGIIGLG